MTQVTPDIPSGHKARAIRLGSLSVPIGGTGWMRRASGAARLGGVGGAIIITGLVFQSENQFFLSTTNMLGLLRSMTTLAILALARRSCS